MDHFLLGKLSSDSIGGLLLPKNVIFIRILLLILVQKEQGCLIAIEKTLDIIGLGQKQHFGIGNPPLHVHALYMVYYEVNDPHTTIVKTYRAFPLTHHHFPFLRHITTTPLTTSNFSPRMIIIHN